MRTTTFVLALATATGAMATLSAAQEAKLSAELLLAIRSDEDFRVDVVVQLASPSQVLLDSCDEAAGMDRAQRTSCVAESLQNFAGQRQQSVRDLLAQSTGLFSSSTFLWINNSVAVRGARRELINALAQLEAVMEIHLEQVIDIQTK